MDVVSYMVFLLMDGTIHFNDQLALMTIEVNNETCYWVLPSEFLSKDPSVS